MANTTVWDKAVSKDEFFNVVLELRDNNDFFDPIYLEGDDWKPFTKEFVKENMVETAKSARVTIEQLWAVIDFLQFYSDVDLTHMVHEKAAGRSVDLIHTWWIQFRYNNR